MQTNLADWIRAAPEGPEADAILRSCVHCGFCNATCPTYQLLGDELDGPRGRIYLIKQVLEGGPPSASTQQHLDRCLTCRNCETTCPSGVRFGRLIDIGRHVVARAVERPLGQRLVRKALAAVLTGRAFGPLLQLGRWVRPLLPAALKNKVPNVRGARAVREVRAGPAGPAAQPAPVRPAGAHTRRMLLLAGCVQPALSPNINAATVRVFDALGIDLQIVPGAGCCGALRYHLDDQAGGLADARRNIDAWWPYLQSDASGVEAIVMNASGCGVMVKDYGALLRNDPAYADKARRVSALTKDAAEILPAFEPQLSARLAAAGTLPNVPLVFQASCTLQHGQRIRGVVEPLLAQLGAHCLPVDEAHLCCGSAGTYSVLHPEMAYPLRDRKLAHLEANRPQAILSANVGCIVHLQSGTTLPVMHWIEWLDQVLQRRSI